MSCNITDRQIRTDDNVWVEEWMIVYYSVSNVVNHCAASRCPSRPFYSYSGPAEEEVRKRIEARQKKADEREAREAARNKILMNMYANPKHEYAYDIRNSHSRNKTEKEIAGMRNVANNPFNSIDEIIPNTTEELIAKAKKSYEQREQKEAALEPIDYTSELVPTFAEIEAENKPKSLWSLIKEHIK